MKKSALLNQALSEIVAAMGHGDLLVIGDAGLPVPTGIPRVDLALCPGVPGFLETVETILTELAVESAYVAAETAERNPRVEAGLKQLLGPIPAERITHEELKRLSAGAVAVVRTGECTSYANVILKAGVTF